MCSYRCTVIVVTDNVSGRNIKKKGNIATEMLQAGNHLHLPVTVRSILWRCNRNILEFTIRISLCQVLTENSPKKKGKREEGKKKVLAKNKAVNLCLDFISG